MIWNWGPTGVDGGYKAVTGEFATAAGLDHPMPIHTIAQLGADVGPLLFP